jgi:hypothetical protein
MSRKTGALIFLLAFAVLTLPISFVYATKPIPVSGGFSASLIPIPVNFAGNNIIFEHSGVGEWTGDISGATVANHRWVAHTASGVTNVHVEVIFSSATVLGESGELTILFLGKTTGPGVGSGTWRIISGTDGLVNLNGGGTWGPGQYEGTVHFDP